MKFTIGKLAILGFLSIFVLVGLGVMSLGIWTILDATGASAWPVSKGTITRSEFLVVQETDEHFRTRPDIGYSYRVSGKDYAGETLNKNVSDTFSPAESRRWVNEHPVDSEVDVYVDPNDATNAVLEPAVPIEAWFFVAFGAIFAGVPTVIGIVTMLTIRRVAGSMERSDRVDAEHGEERQEVVLARRFAKAGRPLFGYVILVGFFGIFLAVGLGMLSYAIPMREREAASVDWPRTQGTVIYRGVEHSTSSSENGTKHTYTPRVVYDYMIDGVTYTDGGITFSDAGSDRRRKAIDAIQPYPKGKQVEVCYDPDDFYNAALVPGTSGGSLILLILGIVFSAVGGLPIVGITIAKLWKSLSLGGGQAATVEGDTYDPFRDTEIEDPFDRPWDDQA